MKDERAELIEDIKRLLNQYNEEILPVLKSAIIYSPAEVSFLCEHYSNLSLYSMFLDTEEDLTEEETGLKEKLDAVRNQMHKILIEKEEDFEEYEESPEDVCDYMSEDDSCEAGSLS